MRLPKMLSRNTRYRRKGLASASNTKRAAEPMTIGINITKYT